MKTVDFIIIGFVIAAVVLISLYLNSRRSHHRSSRCERDCSGCGSCLSRCDKSGS